MSVRMIGVVLLGTVGVLILLRAGVGVTRAAKNASTFAGYWQTKTAEPSSPRAIRVVALGDSIMQAVGADHPDEGIAGLVASYVGNATGREVHISNLSRGGSTTQAMIEDQLPKANFAKTDLVLVASANDLEKRVPLKTYRANLQYLLDALPPEKTIVSDLPLEPGRKPYQAILEQETNERGIARADFAEVFTRRRRLDIFSWLVPHLNSRGYALWFEAFRPQVNKIIARW